MALDHRPTQAFAQAMGETEPVRKPLPADAFLRARDQFRAGERLDMGALAGAVGVSRATLYRWTGDRDRLLGDVAWSEVQLLLAFLDRDERGSGLPRIERLAARFLDTLAASPSLRAFLATEGESGLRILTAPAGGVRPRIVASITGMMEREVQRGGYRPPDEPALLADGIVSIAERFLYHGGDPAANPDPATARRVIALLLRES